MPMHWLNDSPTEITEADLRAMREEQENGPRMLFTLFVMGLGVALLSAGLMWALLWEYR